MLKIFRLLGYLEAISFLVLVGIAMPLKYVYGAPEAVKMVGMGHGVLFMVYIVAASWVWDAHNWPFKRLVLAYFAAVVPMGTIFFDRKYLSHT